MMYSYIASFNDMFRL